LRRSRPLVLRAIYREKISGVRADRSQLKKMVAALRGGDQDVLRFDHTFANLTALENATHQVGANTVITYDATDTITLIGVSVSQLHFDAQHFVLA
jgi:hypothetical protein